MNSPIESVYARAVSRILEETKTLGFTFYVELSVPPYRLDFAFVADDGRKVAVELDGHEHHTAPIAIARDKKRDRFLTLAGWRILRFTGSEVTNSVGNCVNETLLLLKQVSATKVTQVLAEAIARAMLRLSKDTQDKADKRNAEKAEKVARATQEREQFFRDFEASKARS